MSTKLMSTKHTRGVATLVKPKTTLKRKRSIVSDIELEKPISPTELTRDKIQGQWVTHKQCAYIGDDYYAIFFNSDVKLSGLMPIIDEDNEVENGVYTWVILSLNNDEPRMYLKKTLSSYEFGTKHQEILYHITCKNSQCEKYKLYYAGELLKDDNTIKFNLESGTYMKDKLNPKKKTLGTIKMSKINAGDMINERLNKSGKLTIEEVDETFITHEKIPLTLNDLQLYSFFGAKIYKFDNPNNCATFTKRGNAIPLHELGGELIDISPHKTGGKRSRRKMKRKMTLKNKNKNKNKNNNKNRKTKKS